ncbi:MAG: hypothetical protein O6852_06855 [Gammaproteobacteria bacterium]|nr:hypothetical protein [Gammaproteobacteria bacterium]
MTTLAIATIAWVIGLTTAKNALMTMILITATIIFLRIASNFFSKKSSYAMGTEASFVVAMVMVMIFI